jgi:hypothetical protein
MYVRPVIDTKYWERGKVYHRARGRRESFFGNVLQYFSLSKLLVFIS